MKKNHLLLALHDISKHFPFDMGKLNTLDNFSHIADINTRRVTRGFCEFIQVVFSTESPLSESDLTKYFGDPSHMGACPEPGYTDLVRVFYLISDRTLLSIGRKEAEDHIIDICIERNQATELDLSSFSDPDEYLLEYLHTILPPSEYLTGNDIQSEATIYDAPIEYQHKNS